MAFAKWSLNIYCQSYLLWKEIILFFTRQYLPFGSSVLFRWQITKYSNFFTSINHINISQVTLLHLYFGWLLQYFPWCTYEKNVHKRRSSKTSFLKYISIYILEFKRMWWIFKYKKLASSIQWCILPDTWHNTSWVWVI